MSSKRSGVGINVDSGESAVQASTFIGNTCFTGRSSGSNCYLRNRSTLCNFPKMKQIDISLSSIERQCVDEIYSAGVSQSFIGITNEKIQQ